MADYTDPWVEVDRLTRERDEAMKNLTMLHIEWRAELANLARERDELREGMRYADERYRQALPTYDAASREVWESGNQSVLSTTLTAIEMLVREHDEAREDVRRLRALLRKVEWGSPETPRGQRCCPCCGASMQNDEQLDLGHNARCELAAALEGR